MPKDSFLSYSELARLLGLGLSTVRNGQCGTSEIPRLRLGGRVVFSLKAVEAWMSRRSVQAEAADKARILKIDQATLRKKRRRREVSGAIDSILKRKGVGKL